jgi:hypothetical protein
LWRNGHTALSLPNTLKHCPKFGGIKRGEQRENYEAEKCAMWYFYETNSTACMMGKMDSTLYHVNIHLPFDWIYSVLPIEALLTP